MRNTLLALLAVMLTACGGGSTVLDDAYESCLDEGQTEIPGIRVADEGQSILVDGEGEESGSGEATVGDTVCVLQALEVPDSVVSRMDSTSALQGQQEANWGDVHAFWTYHPSNGLDIIIEMEEE